MYVLKIRPSHITTILIKSIALITLGLALTHCGRKPAQNNLDSTFNYNLAYAPQTFDPILQQGTNSRYLLNHLYITMFKWDSENKLIPYGAKTCDWFKKTLRCQLKKKSFQDGTSITAIHYIHSLNLLKKSQIKETLDFDNITYKAIDDKTLEFKVLNRSRTLKQKLALIELAPRKEEKFYKNIEDVRSSTNYILSKYERNQFLLLQHKTKKNLKVKIHFIEDQSTAIRLYKSKTLNLLTLLPVRDLIEYSESKDLLLVNMVRMDGIFINSSLDKNLKKALFHSINFLNLKKLYESIGVPGCPSIPSKFYTNNYCYDYDLKKAKKLMGKVKNRQDRLKLSYSSLGGDDIQRGMEWLAHEWQENLKLKIEVEPLETGLFFTKIRSKDFNIIRKGLPLDAPTCLEALKSFESSSPNNITSFKNKNFDSILTNMQETNNESKLKIFCDKALNILYKNYVFIPLGPMYFSYLQDGKFKGWYINSLNILDLENLDLKNGRL